MHGDGLPKVGSRIETTKAVSYTLDEFADAPLFLQPGDQGTVVSVDTEKHTATVVWDDDPRQDMKKVVSTDRTPPYFRIL